MRQLFNPMPSGLVNTAKIASAKPTAEIGLNGKTPTKALQIDNCGV